MAIKKQLGFQIRGIELIESHIRSAHPFPQNPSFAFTVNLEHNLNIPNKVILVLIEVCVMLDGSQDDILGRIKLNIGFDFPEIERYYTDEKLTLPTDFVDTINSISISTARGVLFSEFKGTTLHTAIFPIVDPKSLSKQVTD